LPAQGSKTKSFSRTTIRSGYYNLQQ